MNDINTIQDIPFFNKKMKCSKCKYKIIAINYKNGSIGLNNGKEISETFEHFYKECKKCHYCWIERLEI